MSSIWTKKHTSDEKKTLRSAEPERDPHPDDPYTIESVRGALTGLVQQLTPVQK